MLELKILLSPVTLTFLIIAIGYSIGKIKALSLSLDISAVLLCAVAAGWLISSSPLGDDAEYLLSLKETMKVLSSLGSAIFVSAIGISSGYSIKNKFNLSDALQSVYGGMIVITGFFLVKITAQIDGNISPSALLGILCGALTSSPGMTAAAELNGVVSEEISLGYGSAYMFGVVFVVTFVQILTRKYGKRIDERRPKCKIENKDLFNFIVQISVAAAIGTWLGQIKIPYLNASLGSSGGMLCFGLLFGFLIRKYNPKAARSEQTVSLFRNIGLVFFFVGSGIPAGLRFNTSFDLKWTLYGMVFTTVPVLACFIVCRVLKCEKSKTACIIAGGMTSSPAVGALINRNMDIDLAEYSMIYTGSLTTMFIGIQFIYPLLC